MIIRRNYINNFKKTEQRKLTNTKFSLGTLITHVPELGKRVSGKMSYQIVLNITKSKNLYNLYYR